jgi:hypothetical protein
MPIWGFDDGYGFVALKAGTTEKSLKRPSAIMMRFAARKDLMVKEKESKDTLCVDKGLVAMFLKMSPEERLRANDNAARSILELRNAYRQRKNVRHRSERST